MKLIALGPTDVQVAVVERRHAIADNTLREKFSLDRKTAQFEARINQLDMAQAEVLCGPTIFGLERTRQLLQDIRRERAELETKLNLANL